jgi:hypothetical protein
MLNSRRRSNRSRISSRASSLVKGHAARGAGFVRAASRAGNQFTISKYVGLQAP